MVVFITGVKARVHTTSMAMEVNPVTKRTALVIEGLRVD
jgi:hypothetical protein